MESVSSSIGSYSNQDTQPYEERIPQQETDEAPVQERVSFSLVIMICKKKNIGVKSLMAFSYFTLVVR